MRLFSFLIPFYSYIQRIIFLVFSNIYWQQFTLRPLPIPHHLYSIYIIQFALFCRKTAYHCANWTQLSHQFTNFFKARGFHIFANAFYSEPARKMASFVAFIDTSHDTSILKLPAEIHGHFAIVGIYFMNNCRYNFCVCIAYLLSQSAERVQRCLEGVGYYSFLRVYFVFHEGQTRSWNVFN